MFPVLFDLTPDLYSPLSIFCLDEYLRVSVSMDFVDSFFPLTDAIRFIVLIARSTRPVTKSQRILSGSAQMYTIVNSPVPYKMRSNKRISWTYIASKPNNAPPNGNDVKIMAEANTRYCELTDSTARTNAV